MYNKESESNLENHYHSYHGNSEILEDDMYDVKRIIDKVKLKLSGEEIWELENNLVQLVINCK